MNTARMIMNKIIEILLNIRKLSGNEQINYLKSVKDTPMLREILYYTSNPNMVYNIKEDKFNKVIAKILKPSVVRFNTSNDWENYKKDLDKLATQKGVKEEDIVELYSKYEFDDLFKGILLKDLRLGMDISSFC
jgi:pimeloyl-CoA synthetase